MVFFGGQALSASTQRYDFKLFSFCSIFVLYRLLANFVMSSAANTVPSLDKLCRQGHVWRGRQVMESDAPRLCIGHTALDEALGGGLQSGSLTEILSEGGLGLSLLLPVLASLGEQARWLAWMAPPHQPYAPALLQAGIPVERILLIHGGQPKQDLWALEQALNSGQCSAVLAWPRRILPAQLRRLQLAAEQGGALGVLFRPLEALQESSPAGFRLSLSSHARGVRVRVHKRRGGWGQSGEILLSRKDYFRAGRSL